MNEEIKEYLKDRTVVCHTQDEAEEFLDFIGNNLDGAKIEEFRDHWSWPILPFRGYWRGELIHDYMGDRLPLVLFKDFKSKFMEEPMNPEKEASKCQEESFAEQARRIAKEEIDKALKDFKWRIEKPLPQPTQKEKNILKALHLLGWSWIARDDDSVLCVYETKPERSKEPEYKEWQTDDDYVFIKNISKDANDLFSFITWHNEPMLIANLIHWGDET